MNSDYASLYMLCNTLDDIEAIRISTAQRKRIMLLPQSGGDTNEVGWGLTEDDVDVQVQSDILIALEVQEHSLEKALRKAMKKHPLGTWVLAQKGVGEKQAARLLAAIGDPYWHSRDERPRTVSELWAYCGLAPGQRRKKGVKSNWSADGKKRTWLIVQSIIRTKGPWRDLWDEARTHYTGYVHSEACNLCGQPGKPAPVGSEWAPRHQKFAADRYVGKRLLRELWRESRRLHGVVGDSDGLTP